VRVLASDPHVRFTMPTWRPDGDALVAAAAPAEQTFNLVELTIEGSAMRQLTHTTGGALWPDVSPNGKTIVFAGYTTGGYDLFSMQYPMDTKEGERAADARLNGSRSTEVQGTQSTAAPVFDYSPLRTLAPTSWTPVIEN